MVSALGVPSCGALWGISTTTGSQAALLAAEARLGRRFDVVYDFHKIGDRLPTSDEEAEVAAGRLLHVNIQAVGYTYAQVASGRADPALIPQATGVAGLKVPVFVTFEHEPDNVASANEGTPAQFVAAWRHVHDLFVGRGASNAVWVWVVTGWAKNLPSYPTYYPGNAYVDWVSWDSYGQVNCPASPTDSGTFGTAVSPMYSWLQTTGKAAGIDPTKPEMLSEYAQAYDPAHPSAQGAWYAAIPSLLAAQFPNIKAVTDWNNSGGNCQYEMTASPTTLAGFVAASRESYVNPTTTTGTPPAPALVGDSGEGENSTGISLGLPVAAQPGDLALLTVSASTFAAPAPPSGWSVVTQVSGGGSTLAVFEHTVVSGDTGHQVQVAFPPGVSAAASLADFTGVAASTPVSAAESVAQGPGVSATTPSIGASTAGDIVVSIWSGRTTGVAEWTAPQGEALLAELLGTPARTATLQVTISSPKTQPGPVGGLSTSVSSAQAATAAATLVLAP